MKLSHDTPPHPVCVVNQYAIGFSSQTDITESCPLSALSAEESHELAWRIFCGLVVMLGGTTIISGTVYACRNTVARGVFSGLYHMLGGAAIITAFAATVQVFRTVRGAIAYTNLLEQRNSNDQDDVDAGAEVDPDEHAPLAHVPENAGQTAVQEKAAVASTRDIATREGTEHNVSAANLAPIDGVGGPFLAADLRGGNTHATDREIELSKLNKT